jgi:glucose-6-phosphate dehydrogenase assembly protein OpcA
MAPDVAIERVVEAPLRVDPAAIEGEFNRIWKETSLAGYDESAVRLRVVNFVAVGADDAATERFERVMNVLPEHHPCRGVLVTMTAGASGIESSIYAHCLRVDGGSRHLCAEVVELRGGPGDEAALASVVLNLLVPELPVAVWLLAPFEPETRLVADLLDAADSVFVDSAGVPEAMSHLERLARAAADHEVALCDLAWSRYDTWRALVAQLFDGPEGAQRLDRVESISVVGGEREASTAALLIAGWLVAQLELQLADAERAGGSLRATLYDGSRGVRLGVVPDTRHNLELASVTIRADGVDFVVQYHAESGHMHVREEWPDGPVHRTLAPTATDDASVFAQALDDSSGPQLYARALAAALALLR